MFVGGLFRLAAVRYIKSGLLLQGFGNGQTFYSSFMIKRVCISIFLQFFFIK